VETAGRYGEGRFENLQPFPIKNKPITASRLLSAFEQRRQAENLNAWQVIYAQTVLTKLSFYPRSLAFLAPMPWESLARSYCERPTIRRRPWSVLNGVFAQGDKRGPRLLDCDDAGSFG
jgi:hypothetical protein